MRTIKTVFILTIFSLGFSHIKAQDLNENPKATFQNQELLYFNLNAVQPRLKAASLNLQTYLKTKPLTPALAASLQNIVDNNPAVDLSVAVMFSNGDIWTGAHGNSHDTAKITPATIFNIGSITKTFVAATILKLVDEGKLSLDDSIYKYLPKYKYVDSCITIRMLLNHTSGVYNFTDNSAYLSQIANSPNIELLPEQVIKQYLLPAIFSPGTSQSYSNTNYLLAGMIISKITGKNAAVYLRDYIFEPFNLTSTFIYPEKRDSLDICDVGVIQGGNDTAGLSSISTAGAMMSTPYDLVKWAAYLYQGKVFSETALKQMLTPPTAISKYGLGVSIMTLISNTAPITVYGHTGEWSNESYFCFSPIDTVAIAACYKTKYANNSIIQYVYNLLKGFPGPINDSICNAIELIEGENSISANPFAGIEKGEPSPPMYNCNVTDGWCRESGMESTTWYWFKAPDNGVINVAVGTYNSRLAIYQSKNADSILNGSYKLIAANDNALSSKYPAVFNIKNLIPNEKYYLQLDGYHASKIDFKIYINTPDLQIELEKDTVILDPSTGNCDSLNLSVTGQWTTSCTASWANISPASGLNNGKLYINSKNDNTTLQDRKTIAKITIAIKPGQLTKYITIIQKPGITDIAENRKNEFSIYPNPSTHEIILINFQSKSQFYIFDITGKFIYSKQSLSCNETIDVSQLPSGIYFIKATNTNSTQVQKFVKE
jgi:D-alanyl-D-alanine carboxypeptidase